MALNNGDLENIKLVQDWEGEALLVQLRLEGQVIHVDFLSAINPLLAVVVNQMDSETYFTHVPGVGKQNFIEAVCDECATVGGIENN